MLDVPNITRIPMRLAPGEPIPFSPKDVILNDGDIVYIESRETDFFYAGGLLGGRRIVLPRDIDTTVMDAIALAESAAGRQQKTNALGGVSVLNQDVTVGASRVIIQRKLPTGKYVLIEVNLYKMMKHPERQLIIQPEDRIILRYTRLESVAAFIERQLLEGAVIGAASSLTFGD